MGKLVDEVRLISSHVRGLKEAAFERRKKRDREARESYLRKRVPGMTEAIYRLCRDLVLEAAADGAPGVSSFRLGPDNERVRLAAEAVAKLLREADGLTVEWKSDHYSCGLGECVVPDIFISIRW